MGAWLAFYARADSYGVPWGGTFEKDGAPEVAARAAVERNVFHNQKLYLILVVDIDMRSLGFEQLRGLGHRR
jgi:hypothetical protein